MDGVLSAKEIKRLADSCRKAGIKTFKGYGVEFTLSDEAPLSNYKKSKHVTAPSAVDTKFESDSLSEDDLLFWSSGVLPGQEEAVD